MNIKEYELIGHGLYSEFAEIIRFIVEQATSARNDLAHPQSVQARAKSLKSLNRKLEQRELSDSENIENEIRDLAGIRIIFYTNIDVERFKNSEIIRANFIIKDIRVHYPTIENQGQQYQGVHYTVCLKPEREVLPEYNRFAGMHCEIQLQTILNHAWSETTHDILYKPKGSEGFGKQAFDSIERRLKNVMDKYLLPAGREMARAQHDYLRAMAGKDLFDRDALELLKKSNDNNERYDILQNLHEYVIPNYDDLPAVFQEIQDALLDAVKMASETQTKPIETPFGSYEGKTFDQICQLAIRILEEWRYINVMSTFGALIRIYRQTINTDRRTQALTALQRLAEYNINIVRQVGYAVQDALVEELALKTLVLADCPEVSITIWRQVLRTEMSNTSFANDTLTISTGAVQPHDSLSKIRRMAGDGLAALLNESVCEETRLKILSALHEATFMPHRSINNDGLYEVVLSGSLRVLNQIASMILSFSFELREAFEDDLLRQYWSVSEIAVSEMFAENIRNSARTIADAIISIRNALNLDEDFVIYKTLVGFETVLPPHWEDDQFYEQADIYRLERADEFIQAINQNNISQWRTRIARCASTKSNDLATFPTFIEFLTRLAERKPWAIEPLLSGANPDLANFLPPLLVGLSKSGDPVCYQQLVDECFANPTRHNALMRHYRIAAPSTTEPIIQLFELALRDYAIVTIIETFAVMIEHHDDAIFALKVGILLPTLNVLTANRDTRWINSVWFLPKAKLFFQSLSAAEAKAVLINMLDLDRIDHHPERILRDIAEGHSELIWDFFRQRLDRKGENRAYHPIPFRFFGLEVELSRDINLAVSTVFNWYDVADPLFRFGGGRLIHNVFPNPCTRFATALIQLIQIEGNRGIDFVLAVLENYTADLSLQDVAKEVVASLQPNDSRLDGLLLF